MHLFAKIYHKSFKHSNEKLHHEHMHDFYLELSIVAILPRLVRHNITCTFVYFQLYESFKHF